MRQIDVTGYELRRVNSTDRAALLDWIARALRAGVGARGRVAPPTARAAPFTPPGSTACPVAFAAADGNNQGLGWFGPAGTDIAHRGKRLGEALLVRCLEDVRGLPEAGVIAWIGPKAFYAKTVGAVDDRRFVTWSRPMTRALILAAGLGTRLGALSDERPKPLLPVCDIPLIRYAVALLRGAGIDEIAVNLHHRGELIRAELGDGFHYSEEPRSSAPAAASPSSPTG